MSDAYLQRAKHPVAVGQVFGFLTVIGPTVTVNRIRNAPVRCECGATVLRRAQDLLKGKTRSCGCKKSELKREAVMQHGMTDSAEYRSWHAMRQRCTNPNFTSYANYGGKGIKVCERWLLSFEAFYEDMGPRPAGTTLDRWPARSGNYESGNCRWATRAEQAQNKDSSVLNPDLVREIRASKESSLRLSRRFGVSYSALCKARSGHSWSNV